MENLDKTYESKLSGKRKAVRSGQTAANLAKQNWQKNLLLYKRWKRNKIENRLTALIVIWKRCKKAVMRYKSR
jgi:hypothetical protein